MQLVKPGPQHLPAYTDALRRSWSPNTLRTEAAEEELVQIAQDPAAFLALMDDPLAAGPPVMTAARSARRRSSTRAWAVPTMPRHLCTRCGP